MSTAVVLLVTLPYDVDPDRQVVAPAEVVGQLRAAGQPTAHGLAQRGGGPWRLHYRLSGSDRVETGRALEASLRALGYDADLSITP